MRLDITQYTTGTEILFTLTEIARDFQALRDERDRLYNALTDSEWLDDGYSKVDDAMNWQDRFEDLSTEMSFYRYALKMVDRDLYIERQASTYSVL